MIFKDTVNFHEIFSNLDWIVFFSFILFMLIVVYYGYSNNKKGGNTAVDYIVMGRQLTLPFFVGTLVSTWYGGILGVTQISFNHGIYNFVTQGFYWYIAYASFACFIAKKIRKHNAITLPELIRSMFGPKSSVLTSFFLFFNVLPITYVISIGILLQFIFPISFITATTLGTSFVVIYSLCGGFRAVVYSDMVQFITMCLAVLLVVIFSFINFGGYSFLSENLPETYFKFTGNFSLSTSLVWFFIACATTLINPSFYQRCFAAKSDKIAVRGIFISIGIWIVFDCCTTLGGMYAKAIIPNADSLNAYLIYGLQLLPVGLKGLLIAGIASTILSTLDSFLFISSTTLSYDLMKNTNFKYKHSIYLVFTSIVTLIFSWILGGDLESIWRVMESYFTSCLLLPLLWGYLFSNKISDKQFVITSLSSVCATSIWLIFDLNKKYYLDSFYIGILSSIILLSSFSIKEISLFRSKELKRL